MPAAGLDEVLRALDDRARSDPRLERHRVVGRGPAALDDVPDGWFASDAVARIATDGGWWPGEWAFPSTDPAGDDIVTLWLTGDRQQRPEATVTWLQVGTIWERDHFWTPTLRRRTTSAPILGFSTQALWIGMVFPTEAALLEAFVVTYDVLGLDERGEINPFFVEWVTAPPAPHEMPEATEVHRRLVEMSSRWTSAHPCWVPSAMPLMATGGFPPDVVAAVLGTSSGAGR